jgi:hypothetical protein
MKIGLYVEGSADEAFYRPLVCHVLGLQADHVIPRRRGGVCIIGLKNSLRSVLKEFAQQACTHLVLTADRHEASPAHAARIAREASTMAGGVPCVVGVAVVQMEAWLLADHDCLGRVLGRFGFQKSPAVESIPDPKAYIRSHFDAAPDYDQLAQIARQMNLEQARKVSRSLDRFLTDLEAWKAT